MHILNILKEEKCKNKGQKKENRCIPNYKEKIENVEQVS